MGTGTGTSSALTNGRQELPKRAFHFSHRCRCRCRSPMRNGPKLRRQQKRCRRNCSTTKSRSQSNSPSQSWRTKAGNLPIGRSADPPICCINEAARDTLSGNARLSRGKVSVPFGCSFWSQVGAQRRAARHWGAAASKASKASHCLAFAIISWGVC